MKKIGNFIKKNLSSPAFLAAAASLVIMTIVLLMQPVIGMADNGDFYRTMEGQGIYKLDRYEDDQFLDYFSSKFGLYQYYYKAGGLVSSHNIYIQAAKVLNHLVQTDQEIFDIRCFAVFLMLQLAVCIYMIVDYVTYNKQKIQSIILAGIGVTVFADTAYTAYFNSFYAEGVVYVSCFMLVAATLLLAQNRYSPYMTLSIIVINGIILIFTKQQNATEGLPLFILLILIAFLFPPGQKDQPERKRKRFRRVSVSAAVILAATGILMYAIIPAEFIRINQYQAMTRGVLMVGDNPETTLDEFGISRQYSLLDGSIYFEKYPSVEVESQQLVDNFYSKYGFVSIAVHYLTHPADLIEMLDIAVKNGYMIRPDVQGNYERSAGRAPAEKTNVFTFYSEAKRDMVPNTFGFVAIWLLVVCGLSFKDHKKLLIILCMMMMGLIQVGTSIVGDGDADLAKHLFLYNIVFDIITYISFAPLITEIITKILKGIYHFLFKRKKKVMVTAALILGISCSIKVNAAASEQGPIRSQAIIIVKAGEDASTIEKITEACGVLTKTVPVTNYNKEYLEEADFVITTVPLPLKDIEQAGIPAICMGTEFDEIPGCTVEEYSNQTVRFSYQDFRGNDHMLEYLTVLSSTGADTIGTIRLGGEKDVPFAALADDNNYYIPCFNEQDTCALAALGAVINKTDNDAAQGRTYFVIDQIYAFSDLEKVCRWADILNQNGIPFIARIMPLYENLQYPAFLRFTQDLRYIQSRGGTIVLHEPLIEEMQMEIEPIETKMKRLTEALSAEDIYFRDMPVIPYILSLEELLQISSDSKNFGQFPFDMMIGVTPEITDTELIDYIQKVNSKWMSFYDYQKDFENSTYLYMEKDMPEDFQFRGKNEVKFEVFFAVSDKMLIILVGISLAILGVILIIGRKWYKRKFYR